MSQLRAARPPTAAAHGPYLDGPQPGMLRLEGHNLGRVRDVEEHVEALVLLQDPPCGPPDDGSVPGTSLGGSRGPTLSQEPWLSPTHQPQAPQRNRKEA